MADMLCDGRHSARLVVERDNASCMWGYRPLRVIDNLARMECASCGLDNDPSATHCARCDILLSAPAFIPAGGPGPARMPYGPPQPSPPGRGFPLVPVLVGLAVVLLVGVIAVGVLLVRDKKPTVPGTAPASASTTTKAAPTAREQAEVINRLLDESTASRDKLNKAIDKVNHCTQLDAALADMRAVGDERNQQIATLDAADVTAIDTGSLRSSLKSALQAALGADQQFVAWATPTVSGGCGDTAARTAAWNRAQTFSKQAQAAKKKFVALWNPVARPLGFEERSTQRI